MAGYALPTDVTGRFDRLTAKGEFRPALEALYHQYAPALREFCKGRLGDSAEAEDACHDALLKAYRALPRFRPGPVWPWLTTIAANVCLDVQRNRMRMIPSADQYLERPTQTLEEEAESQVRTQVVAGALRCMPERYRSYIYARDFDGWSYEQIAEFYGTSVAAVRSALLRARRALRVQIKQVARKERQWPLPALFPGAWPRLRSLLADFRCSIREAIGPYLRFVAAPLESVNTLAPALLNAAVVAIIISALGVGDGARINLPTDQPNTLMLTAITQAAIPQPGPLGEGGSEPRSTAPAVNVSVSPPPDTSDEGSTTIYESPTITATAEPNNDGEGAWLQVGPKEAQCPPPDYRGIATAIICPIIENT